MIEAPSRAAQSVTRVYQMINLKFSRSDELEPDSLSVEYMGQGGYDPRSFPDDVPAGLKE